MEMTCVFEYEIGNGRLCDTPGKDSLSDARHSLAARGLRCRVIAHVLIVAVSVGI